MAERSLRTDLATIGVGIGIPVTFLLGVMLLLLTALTGKAPIWLAGPFILIGIGSGVSYLVIRRSG
ncbi:MAG TPA: hypothetical protein ENH15_05815 [Actinobacteria bacterium]|nr:hypothetical protein [Actinomycetota bacterium]